MGHKTNGDWSDVTSLGRNDIVFEGRNKIYGAYYIRQQYDRALLLGLLFSLSLIVVGGGVPLLISKLTHHNIPAPAIFDKDHLIYQVVNITPPTPPKKNVTPPPPTPPKKQPEASNNPPVVAVQPMHIDTDKTQRDLLHQVVGTTDIPGKQTQDPGPQPTPNPQPPSTGVAEAPFHIVEHMPKFPGDMADFISKHVDFPSQYTTMGIQGTVYATFIVEPDGSISNIHILRGIAGAELLNDATVKGLQQMPKWEPGSQNGHNVRVQYTLPVKFELH